MEEKQMPLRLLTVEQAISKASGVTVQEIRGHNRQKEMAEARQAVWYIAHDYLGYSYSEIGRYYQRDHTTVMHGVGKMRKNNAGESLIAGIKKVCPEVLIKPLPGEAKTVRDYQF